MRQEASVSDARSSAKDGKPGIAATLVFCKFHLYEELLEQYRRPAAEQLNENE